MVMSRRDVLVGSVLLGCGGAKPAPGAPPPARKVPFQVIDLVAPFWSFWDEARGRPLAEQSALFRSRIVAPNDKVYAANVLRLPPDDPTALDKRIDAWLPKIPAIEPDMRRIHRTFQGGLAASTETFLRALPDFSWSGDVYLFASIDSFNGGGRTVGGKPSLLFGLDVIAEAQPQAKLAVLMHHELFHFYQEGGTNSVAESLWIEGLAEYASIVLNPGTTDDEALPFSHRHDQADPQLTALSRKVRLGTEMPAYAKELGPLLLADLDSQDPAVYADYFLGRAGPRIHGKPVRSGYWFGLQLVRRIARGRPLPELARLAPTSMKEELRRELTAMTNAMTQGGASR